MRTRKQNPAAPARALAGSGTSISSAAIRPDQYTIAPVIATLRRRFGLSDHVAALIADLAGIGPQEVR